MSRPRLHVPPDALEANEEWGANCGPCAIAALLGLTLAEVRPALGAFRGCMNTTEVFNALYNLGSPAQRRCPAIAGIAGCAHIMFDGPWSAAGPRVQYRYSHWLAYRRAAHTLFVYDMNVGEAGGWLPLKKWEAEILPQLLPKKGTGYHVNAWLEVRLDWPLGGGA